MALILLDAGHSGLFRGHYLTSGKRADHDKFRFNEGVVNRAVVAMIQSQLDKYKVPSHIVAPENKDVPLHTRVNRVNEMARAERCFLLSIHHNAGPSTARGFEMFTSPGLTLSDNIASYVGTRFREEFNDRRYRLGPNGDPDKEAKFIMLTKTSCPAILSEWGFFTHPVEAFSMSTPRGIAQQGEFWADCLIEIYKEWLVQ